MSIIRVKHNKENPYVMINREALWDKNLSLEATGLWVRLLSRPDDWHINVIELSKSCGVHKNTIYKLLNELEKNRYCSKEQVHGLNGKFKTVEYHVYEKKMADEEIKIILPLHKKPDAAKPDAAARALLNNDDIENKDSTSPAPLYTKEEEEFFSQRMKEIPKPPKFISPQYKEKVIQSFRDAPPPPSESKAKEERDERILRHKKQSKEKQIETETLTIKANDTCVIIRTTDGSFSSSCPIGYDCTDEEWNQRTGWK